MDILGNELLQYCESGDLDGVQYLISQGVDIDIHKDSMLQRAIYNGYLNMVQYLISLGADISAVQGYMLRHSAYRGHLDVVQYLISNGAIVESAGDYVINCVHRYGIIVPNSNVRLLQQEYDKLKFIRNKLSKLIHIKQPQILLNINSFQGTY